MSRSDIPSRKYRLYVDESGNPDLSSSDDPNHRFLSLTGIIIELSYVQDTVYPELEALKQRFFRQHPDEPVVLHRKDIVNARGPFESLRNNSTRSEFNRNLLTLLRTWQYTVITVCIDKKKHRDTYSTWRYDPYHYCLAVLVERYIFFLKRHAGEGDIMAESRGGKEDRRLKASFRRLWENGTDYVAPSQFQRVLTSKELKVKPKANNIAGLQLADVIALPSRNEILNEQNLLGRSIRSFPEKVIDILASKYDRESGRLYGKKFI